MVSKFPMKYDKGMQTSFIIGAHEKQVKQRIFPQLNKDTAFINSTWIELDSDLRRLISYKPKKIVVYSGADWENTICRPMPHKFINKHSKVYYIGNSNTDNYFSFWMDFVYTNLQKFLTFDTIPNNISKVYMCLNRKPHSHRVELVRKLLDKNLMKLGYVSLGTFPKAWDYAGIDVPITLENDIVNEIGDLAVAGDAGGITNDITSLGNPYYWNTHFLNVVTETTIHTDVFLSEKIFKPIIGLRPFVVLGDDNVYNKLHEWGIDTFDDILGDGYKSRWHTGRINWIIDTITNLQNQDLDRLYQQILPRLKKNKQQFLKIAKLNNYNIKNLKLGE